MPVRRLKDSRSSGFIQFAAAMANYLAGGGIMAVAAPPLTLGEILDRTVQLYRRNFLLLAGIATPAAALTSLVSGAFVLFFSHQIFALGQLGQGGADTTQAATEAGMFFGLAFTLFILVGLPLLLFAYAMSLSALNYASFHVNQGEKVTILESYKYGFSHFWRHVGILFLQSLFAGVVPYFVFGALVVIGAILAALVARTGAGNSLAALFGVLLFVLIIALVVVCVLLWLRFSLAYAASVTENKKAWESIKRSNQLSQGTRGRISIMFLLVGIMTFVVTAALAIPIDIVIAVVMKSSLTSSHPSPLFLTLVQAANLVAGFVVRIFVTPIYAAALLLFYNDQRTRQEGYDIEQLMSRAGWGQFETPAAIVPSTPHVREPLFSGFTMPAEQDRSGESLPGTTPPGPPEAEGTGA
jgi:hypothetical protein